MFTNIRTSGDFRGGQNSTQTLNQMAHPVFKPAETFRHHLGNMVTYTEKHLYFLI